ncbi:putative oxygenase MesX [Microbacterium sp. 18062]|uniref:putative oxygenase MesX n=1 Tax=Microbacterium sp. 18062 TaxID=2681410 RepID=UPI0013568C27|nr:putative oxygenase MesX [Microbacterium sp. 18062]
MANEFTFSITTTRFDEDYSPSDSSRITTNFANLARGEHRQENLRNALAMIDRRFNDLAHGDNPTRDRYTVELEIVSVGLQFTARGADQEFPLLEILDVQIVDLRTGERRHGIVGNNFSSYVRDFDFSVLLPAAGKTAAEFTIPDDFGELHGKLFRHFLDSEAYRERFPMSPVICISVSTSKTYRRTEYHHPVLGVEYRQDDYSLTDEYFRRMGLQVRYFMPPAGVAPLAFYFRGDLVADYSDLQLVGTISTMETFQKIYRPEIYNANSAAARIYRPSLEQQDYSRAPIAYDRDERDQLAKRQGRYTEEHFMKPHGKALERWAATYPVLVG